MIISQASELGAFAPRAPLPLGKRRRRLTPRQLARLQHLQRRRHRLHGAELGAIDPLFIMNTGVVPPWNGRDPRQALTNAAQTAYNATHPAAFAGVDPDGLIGRVWAWLKGER